MHVMPTKRKFLRDIIKILVHQQTKSREFRGISTTYSKVKARRDVGTQRRSLQEIT